MNETEEEKAQALEFSEAVQLYVYQTSKDLIAALVAKDYALAVLIKQSRDAIRDVLNMKRYERNRLYYFGNPGVFE